MVALKNERSPEILSTLENCKAHIERLFQELAQKRKTLEDLKRAKKYTAQVKREISRVEADMNRLDMNIRQIEKMMEFPPGSCVTSDDYKPGKVIDLVVAGKIPEVHVRWWGSTVAVPERPFKLKLVEPEQLAYVWSGDRCSKLVRRLDRLECEEIAVLQDELASVSECLAIAQDSGTSTEVKAEYQQKITYLKKRIKWVNEQDFYNLEHTVQQGIDIFYRVGEALAEIRDRKLYKQAGYKDFQVYLKEKWHMGKSKAYRLIDSATVVSNIVETKKSVPHGGQKILPQSERVTRELTKLTPEQQVEAWDKAIEQSNGNPTAAQVKEVVQNFDQSTTPNLMTQFVVGQVVRINSDRSDKRLIGHNKSYGLITAVNPSSVDVKLWNLSLKAVSPNDIELVTPDCPPSICTSFSLKKMSQLLTLFDSPDEIYDCAIAARSLIG
ncbi:MAG: hypothetical protein AAGE96_09090 [Cyanobacteria bacterium P01_G01_bin.19]